VRQTAVLALGRVGAGNKDLVSTLAPLLVDADIHIRAYADRSLESVDPDWKKSPKLKPALGQVIKALAHTDAQVRLGAVEATVRIGPAEGFYAALERMHKAERDPAVKRRADFALEALRRLKKAAMN
jgi:HEAT repeat protein